MLLACIFSLGKGKYVSTVVDLSIRNRMGKVIGKKETLGRWGRNKKSNGDQMELNGEIGCVF